MKNKILWIVTLSLLLYSGLSSVQKIKEEDLPPQYIEFMNLTRYIILEQEKILVAPCICRREHQMVGEGCDKPMESCLVFGTGAEYYEENGLGRFISQEEALNILENAERSGLVLQPSNAQKVINICTCCGCCCQILKNLKKLPDPAHYVASNYFASIDADACTACGQCEDGRCPVDAIKVMEEAAVVDSARCIGCGLCATVCDPGAIAMVPREEPADTPENAVEMGLRIMTEKGKLERFMKLMNR